MYINAIRLDFTKMLPYWKWFLQGTWTTVWVSILTVLLGTIAGFLVVLLKRSKFKPLNWIATVYTTFFRGTPILLQLYIIVFGLPAIGLKIPDVNNTFSSLMISCLIALTLNSAAYVSEIIRGGLNSVDKGQSEAARSLGLDASQTMRFVIIPQAIKTILPALVNEFIMMIKETSLVSTLGLQDVMYQQKLIQGLTYRTLEPYIIIAAIYLVLTLALTAVSNAVERKLRQHG